MNSLALTNNKLEWFYMYYKKGFQYNGRKMKNRWKLNTINGISLEPWHIEH